MVAQILRCRAALAHDFIRSDCSCRIPNNVLGLGGEQLRFADHSSRKRTASYFRWTLPDRSPSDVFRRGDFAFVYAAGSGLVLGGAGFALIIPVIVLRILNEETILRQELAGYPEYCLRTCSRLIPFVR